MHRLAAQMDRGRHRPGGQHGIGQREERVTAPVQAGVEIIAEVAQSVVFRVHARKCAIAARRDATHTSPGQGTQLNHKVRATPTVIIKGIVDLANLLVKRSRE